MTKVKVYGIKAMTDSDLNICNMCRFGTIVEMLDISNLNIEIKTRAQFLSPNVVYGVYLIFKFCDSRKCSSKPVYVNLKYKKGLESLHAYFATWRDKDWMMIELYQFLNRNEDVVFEFLLESFSSYYCGESAVVVEGIEFRAIDKVSLKLYPLVPLYTLLFIYYTKRSDACQKINERINHNLCCIIFLASYTGEK